MKPKNELSHSHSMTRIQNALCKPTAVLLRKLRKLRKLQIAVIFLCMLFGGNAHAGVAGFASSQGPAEAVQAASSRGTSISSREIQFPRKQTAGNMNFVVVTWDYGSASTPTVTDSSGNVYTQVSSTILNTDFSSGGRRQIMFYSAGIKKASTNTVYVNFGLSVTMADIKVAEYSGIAKNPLIASASATGTSANPTVSLSVGSNQKVLILTGLTSDNHFRSCSEAGGSKDRVASAQNIVSMANTAREPMLSRTQIGAGGSQTTNCWTHGSAPWLIQSAAFKISQPTPTDMPSHPIQYVRSHSIQDYGTSSLSLNNVSQTMGNFAIVVVSSKVGKESTGLSDGDGTYTALSTVNQGALRQTVYYKVIQSTNSSRTITSSLGGVAGSELVEIKYVEYRGLTSSSLLTNSYTKSTSGHATLGSPINTEPHGRKVLLVGIALTATSQAITAGNGFTTRVSDSSRGPVFDYMTYRKGQYNALGITKADGDWILQMLVFK